MQADALTRDYLSCLESHQMSDRFIISELIWIGGERKT
jgi:hypothetical protein